jgi:hypothetical protein
VGSLSRCTAAAETFVALPPPVSRQRASTTTHRPNEEPRRLGPSRRTANSGQVSGRTHGCMKRFLRSVWSLLVCIAALAVFEAEEDGIAR